MSTCADRGDRDGWPETPKKAAGSAITKITSESPGKSPELVGESTQMAQRADVDTALRAAISAALDDKDFVRAKGLIDFLESPPPRAPVLELLPRRRR